MRRAGLVGRLLGRLSQTAENFFRSFLVDSDADEDVMIVIDCPEFARPLGDSHG